MDLTGLELGFESLRLRPVRSPSSGGVPKQRLSSGFRGCFLANFFFPTFGSPPSLFSSSPATSVNGDVKSSFENEPETSKASLVAFGSFSRANAAFLDSRQEKYEAATALLHCKAVRSVRSAMAVAS